MLNKSPRLSIKIVGYIFIVAIIYSFLILIDFFLPRPKWVLLEKAAAIEEKRREKVDSVLIKEARSLGYLPYAAPYLFDSKPFRSLAHKYRIAPLGTFPNKKVYACNEGYGQVRFLSDRFGLRNKDVIWDNLTSIDSIVIGDSFAFGSCVNDEQSISGQLDKLGIVNINIASGGNQPIQYTALANTFLPLVKPKNVIVIFYPNDMNEERSDSIYYLYNLNMQDKTPYFEFLKNGKLRPSTPFLKFFEEAKPKVLDFVKSNANVISDLSKSKVDWALMIGKKSVKYFSLSNIRNLFSVFYLKKQRNLLSFFKPTQLTIDTLLEICNDIGCNPLFVYIPNSEFWRPDPIAIWYKNTISEYLEGFGQKLLDTSPELEKLGMAAYAIKGPHLSPKGYQIVANEIALRIKK
jgi:hypothetical protein